ncbi:hypothetical protein Q73_03650 [Bacillus coahuilensis m2-6]|uniref:EthD domain-containing protein n=1 Tax=Bacillus coahuilensis p1.1.43 TaxID=1150625 RepID=A0A147KAG4_9BACI|nr:EthD family reductase [Bacillus coahuilensis]KUP07719.1 hypothetical protein Q75_04235 [Bacillus coahuilensis p1.1.43]KUP09178.1 hypothetical protein Q73_03650 [Bacillus coahuilensis m2-6]
MPKVIVLFEKPSDVEGFEKHYFEVHVPLAQRVKEVSGAAVQRVLSTQNTDLTLYLVTELTFDSKEALEFALASEEWAKVTEDVSNLMNYLEKPPIVTVVE